ALPDRLKAFARTPRCRKGDGNAGADGDAVYATRELRFLAEHRIDFAERAPGFRERGPLRSRGRKKAPLPDAAAVERAQKHTQRGGRTSAAAPPPAATTSKPEPAGDGVEPVGLRARG